MPEWAAGYVGIPYDEADCWTLARRVLVEQFWIFVPSYADEPVDVALAIGKRHFTEVDAPRAGDLVLMRRLGRPHIGVMLDGVSMLHTSRGKNAVVERISSIRHKVTGYYRA